MFWQVDFYETFLKKVKNFSKNPVKTATIKHLYNRGVNPAENGLLLYKCLKNQKIATFSKNFLKSWRKCVSENTYSIEGVAVRLILHSDFLTIPSVSATFFKKVKPLTAFACEAGAERLVKSFASSRKLSSEAVHFVHLLRKICCANRLYLLFARKASLTSRRQPAASQMERSGMASQTKWLHKWATRTASLSQRAITHYAFRITH